MLASCSLQNVNNTKVSTDYFFQLNKLILLKNLYLAVEKYLFSCYSIVCFYFAILDYILDMHCETNFC